MFEKYYIVLNQVMKSYFPLFKKKANFRIIAIIFIYINIVTSRIKAPCIV